MKKTTRRIPRLFLRLLPVAFCGSPLVAHAFHEAAYGLQAAVFANNAIVASPPLPMLFMKSGAKRLTLQPGYFEGKIDSENTAGTVGATRTRGQFFGGGGAVAFNYGFSESWGLYVMGLGANLGGSFSYTTDAGNCPACTVTSMKDIKASFGSFGAGLNWTFFGGKESDVFSAGLLFGPSITAASLSQQVVQVGSDGVTSNDFRMKMSPLVPSIMTGLQMGFRVSSVLINPYLMAGTAVGGGCYDYEVTETTVSGSLVGESTPQCGGQSQTRPGTTRNQVDLKGDFTSVGVNLVILPIGLGINVFAVPDKPTDVDLKSLEIKTYFVAFSLETD